MEVVNLIAPFITRPQIADDRVKKPRTAGGIEERYCGKQHSDDAYAPTD